MAVSLKKRGYRKALLILLEIGTIALLLQVVLTVGQRRVISRNRVDG